MVPEEAAAADDEELVREGEGNEAERVELLEAHRAEVVAKIDELQHNLELVDYKLGLYRERCRT